jgi:thioredoxin reductase (NADPH)
MELHRQTESFGASFLIGEVCSLKKENGVFIVCLEGGITKKAAAVIVATGSKPRLLGIPGEKEFTGKGVSYCATCDGNFFKGKKIFVVGG